MQNRPYARIPLLQSALCAALLLSGLALVRAEDAKTDPTGSWSWTVKGRNGSADRKMSIQLKLDGDKLTGKLVAPGRNGRSAETEIKDAKFSNGEYSFTVTRERNGNTTVMKYTFKVSGDSLKGKVVTERNGEAGRERDWEAKVDKSAPEKSDAAK